MKPHTPEPWHVGRGNGEGSVFAESGRMRLEAGGTTLYPICNVIDFEGEGEANECLIEAAPELLESLEWITRCVSFKGPHGTTLYAISNEHMAAAKSAVAKAKGVQP